VLGKHPNDHVIRLMPKRTVQSQVTIDDSQEIVAATTQVDEAVVMLPSPAIVEDVVLSEAEQPLVSQLAD
jgi:hypothetical protein